MKKGITEGVHFTRIKMPTVGLPLLQREIFAAFKRPRIRMLSDYSVKMPNGDVVVIPEGFESDGGSVPVFLLLLVAFIGALIGGAALYIGFGLLLAGLLLNPFGLMLIAFLVHDFAVRYRCLLLEGGGCIKIRDVWAANRYMRRVNYMVNDMHILGFVAHTGVTLGAWFSWSKHRKNDAGSKNDISSYIEALS